jgi:hypothetical protein
MNPEQAREFCEKWLAAWTGNDPNNLLKFYAEDAHYVDPVVPAGLYGHVEMLPYLCKLLARNPDWVWQVDELFPNDNGFILKWKAFIPRDGKNIHAIGMDIVDLDNGKIVRNEVYFDRSILL